MWALEYVRASISILPGFVSSSSSIPCTFRSGVERVCIVNSDRKISSVITQSTALKFCNDNIKLFAEGAHTTTVNDMHLHVGVPLVIHENARPLTAFRIMADNVR
jgi:hypothetical protein